MELGYCFDCNEMNYAITNNNGVYERANMSSNHFGHNQHIFLAPINYCPPIRNVLTKLQAKLPISHNEMVIFRLAIVLGELDRFNEQLPKEEIVEQETQLTLF